MGVKERLKRSEAEIYREAGELLKKGAGAIEFAERFFGPQGRLRELWTNEAERREVVASKLYKDLQTQLADLRRREAKTFEQAVEVHSGRITIVVPRSLHAALKKEAALEGISLSELIRLKLSSASYRSIASLIAAGLITPSLPGPEQKGRVRPKVR